MLSEHLLNQRFPFGTFHFVENFGTGAGKKGGRYMDGSWQELAFASDVGCSDRPGQC